MNPSELNSPGSKARQGGRAGDGPADDRPTLTESAAAAAEQQAETLLSDAKRSATAAAGDASEAVDEAAAVLSSRGQETLSQAAAALSSRLENLATYFETRSLDDLTREARTLAAQNPALFIAGGVAVGFALSRFFKASSGTPESHASNGGAHAGTTTRGPTAAPRPDEGERHG